MLKDTDKVRVENRNNATVCYRVPESKLVKRFVAYETKEISMGELRQAVQVSGTKALIEDDLIIHSKEAVDELFPNAEPEYFYTVKDVDFLLMRGTEDQLLDALDFAPEGVINLIKDQAVKIELNDMRKRKAILNKTGFDVTKAIEIKHLSETKTNDTENKVRRAAPVGQLEETPSTTSTRRADTPKYTITQKTI